MEPMAMFWAVVGLGLVGLCFALYAAKRQGRAPLEYVRIVMCFLFLIASIVPFVHLIVLYLAGERRLGDFTKESFATFGLATLLGAFALATLFIQRRAHFVAGVLFFGHWAGMMFMDITTNAVVGRVFRSLPDAVLEYGFRLFLLAVAIAGLVIEILCERRKEEPAA